METFHVWLNHTNGIGHNGCCCGWEVLVGSGREMLV